MEPVVDPTQKLKPENLPPLSKEPASLGLMAYTSEGIQITVATLLGFYLGTKLDQWKHSYPWFTVSLSLLGFAVSFANFLRRCLKK